MRFSIVVLIVLAASVASAPTAVFAAQADPLQVWINCVNASVASQSQSNLALAVETAFASCQTEEEASKAYCLTLAPTVTAAAAESFMLQLKLATKQDIMERAAHVPQPTQAPPDVNQQEACRAAAGLLNNPTVNAYWKQFALDVLRTKCMNP